MQKTTNFNDNTFFLLKQYKIFHLVEYQISNDDPVRKLSKILEAMNFNKLMLNAMKVQAIMLENIIFFQREGIIGCKFP